MSEASERAYQLAYSTHYKTKDLQEAYRLYLSIVLEYPDTNEAKYAQQQIGNLKGRIDIDSIELDPSLHQKKEELNAIEAEHMEREAKREKEEKARQEERDKKTLKLKQLKETMLLSTCPSLDGYHITAQHGLVFGECVFKTGFLKSLEASFSDMVSTISFGDKELSGITGILDNARNFAIRKMIDAAAEKGANAIIGIDSESSFGGSIMHITISGTAVEVESNTKQQLETSVEQ